MENKNFSCNSFAFVLGNSELESKFLIDVSEVTENIENKYNLGQDFNWIQIKWLKSVGITHPVLRVETSVFVDVNELADAVHETLPRHGIAVLSWSEYCSGRNAA